MSAEYWFYEVSHADIEEKVKLDELDSDCALIRADGTEPSWVYDVASKAEVHNWTVNLFEAGESLFGRKPVSISMGPYEYSYRFRFDDGSWESVERVQLEPYYFDDVFDAFVYKREVIGRLAFLPGSIDLRDFDMRLIGIQEAMNILQRYISENEDNLDDEWAGDYYLRPVYVLVKVMLVLQRGGRVLCEVG